MDSIINRMTPGAGAAGGLGYAFLMFLHARLRPGIDIVFDEIHLKERIKMSIWLLPERAGWMHRR